MKTKFTKYELHEYRNGTWYKLVAQSDRKLKIELSKKRFQVNFPHSKFIIKEVIK